MHEEAADVASFLKKYLREVPDRPLFTTHLEREVCREENGMILLFRFFLSLLDV
jgi:hypothetical protein